MKLRIVEPLQRGSRQTVVLEDDNGDARYMDVVDLSKQQERRRFEKEITKKFPELKSKDIEAQQLNLLWQVKDAREMVEAPREGSQANRLVKLVEDRGIILFHNTIKSPFAYMPMEGHSEIWRVRSKQFKQWLARELWQKEGKTPNSDAVNSALNVIEGKAYFDGQEFKLYNRVAWHDGDLWFDLADENWRAIKVTPEGWGIVDHPPILFQRYSHQLPQVEPVSGGDVKLLMQFINLKDERQRLLLLVYIATCFIPDIPHPIPQLYGEKGSAKTTLFRIIKKLVDPSAVEVLSIPSDISQLVQKLSHHWVAYFDNVSHLSDWASDVFCRASTGEGFTKRELYTDDEDVIYSFRRCVGLNGVNVAAMRPDLLDRIILFELERISRTQRREERELFDRFEEVTPAILGGIFDVLSKALAVYSGLSLKALPRMADFARWAAAISIALGYSESDFLEAYEANIQSQTEEVLTSNPVAEAVLLLMEDSQIWEGTPAELLEQLEAMAEKLKIRTKAKSWPGAPHILTRRLNELKGNLREVGVIIEDLPRTGQQGRKLRISKNIDAPLPKSKEIIDTSDTSDIPDIEPALEVSDATSDAIGLSDATGDASGDTGDGSAKIASLSGEAETQLRNDAGDASAAVFPTLGFREEQKNVLGMSVDKALHIWHSQGAPVIHLGPGENCFDLEKLLSGHPSLKHLEAVREWLETNRRT